MNKSSLKIETYGVRARVFSPCGLYDGDLVKENDINFLLMSFFYNTKRFEFV